MDQFGPPAALLLRASFVGVSEMLRLAAPHRLRLERLRDCVIALNVGGLYYKRTESRVESIRDVYKDECTRLANFCSVDLKLPYHMIGDVTCISYFSPKLCGQ